MLDVVMFVISAIIAVGFVGMACTSHDTKSKASTIFSVMFVGGFTVILIGLIIMVIM